MFLDKIKAFGEAAKNAALYVFGPLILVAGYVLYLVSRNRTLSEQVAEGQVQQKEIVLKEEEKEIDEKASVSSDDYNRLRDEYLKEFYKSNPLAKPADVPAGDSGGEHSNR